MTFPLLPEAPGTYQWYDRISGNCDILTCLKADAFSEVFLCRERASGLLCTAKASGDPKDISQFQNEFRILNALLPQLPAPLRERFSRPVRLKEETEGPPAAVYLRTYIPGCTLETLVESRPAKPGLSRSESVRYVLSVLELLTALHGCEPPVLHLDIKPQNIIVTADGSCALIDFGIARFEGTAADPATAPGTPAVAPPEQFANTSPDRRSDLYAAGVLLRYCLTGEYAEKADYDIEADLREVIRKAVRPAPEERFRSAEEMAEALKQTSGEQITDHRCSG